MQKTFTLFQPAKDSYDYFIETANDRGHAICRSFVRDTFHVRKQRIKATVSLSPFPGAKQVYVDMVTGNYGMSRKELHENPGAMYTRAANHLREAFPHVNWHEARLYVKIS